MAAEFRRHPDHEATSAYIGDIAFILQDNGWFRVVNRKNGKTVNFALENGLPEAVPLFNRFDQKLKESATRKKVVAWSGNNNISVSTGPKRASWVLTSMTGMNRFSTVRAPLETLPDVLDALARLNALDALRKG